MIDEAGEREDHHHLFSAPKLKWLTISAGILNSKRFKKHENKKEKKRKRKDIHGLLLEFWLLKIFNAKDLGDKFGKFDYGRLVNDIWELLLILLDVIMILCLLKAASLILGDACYNT